MKRIAYGVSSMLVIVSQSAHASRLPQMDPTWHANQLLWLAVSFGVLYACVSLFIAPAIKAVLTTRETAINDAIAEAERAKHAAESTRSDTGNSGQSARIKAAEIMAKAQAENNADAAHAIAKLDHDLARRADHAAAVLEDSVKKASASIDEAAQSLARTMATKLLAHAPHDEATPNLKLAKN